MPELRVGIIGYGTVGKATADIIGAKAFTGRSEAQMRVTAVCRRSQIPLEAIPEGAKAYSDWRQAVKAEDVDVVVETIGGVTVAREVVTTALELGKPIVTANKNLIAEHGNELFALANRKGIPLYCEAAVAGGVPILRTISEAMAGERMLAVYGVLNGTCNYILCQMAKTGASFDTALAEAQQAGYAEADPTFDIDGIDSRDKLCILTRAAFGGRLPASAIPTTGIRRVTATDVHHAERLNCVIRLVASAERNGDAVEVVVSPRLVKSDSMLGKVEHVNNAVFLVGERIGTQMLFGRGAGGDPTGAAVVSDLVEIAKNVAASRLAAKHLIGFLDSHDLKVCAEPKAANWYLRLTVVDRPGILAQVASVIAEQGINVDSVVQEPHYPHNSLSFVLTVGPVPEPTMAQAVRRIDEFDFMLEPVFVMRIH